jgi:small subunit ribosomal protein S17
VRRGDEEKMASVTAKAGKEKERKMLDGTVLTRGRTFRGVVTKKFEKRVVVEFERTFSIKKYERYAKKKTRLHARIPDGIQVHVGDFVKVRECRPLSKIIHFVVIDILKGKEEGK